LIYNLNQRLLPIFIIIILLPLVAVQAALQTADLSLESAVDMALKNNESYLSALQDKLKAEGEIREARAGALPSLTFEGLYTHNFELQEFTFAGESFKIGTDNYFSLGLKLDQTLFGGGKVFNAYKIAKLYDKYARQGVRIATHEVVYGTHELFFAAILARDNVEVFRDAVSQSQENFKVVQSRYNEGLASEYDKLSAEVDLANLIPQLTRAKNNARIVLNNLRYFIGYDNYDDLELIFNFDMADTIATPDLESSIRTALSNRPDYVGQDYVSKAYKKAIGVSKSGQRPSLYFSAAMDWQANIDKSFPGSNDFVRSTSATLNLVFPIFDGFRTSGSVKKAKADYVKSQLAMSQIGDAIRIEVEEAIGSIEESKGRLASGQKTIELAREGLRVANLRFNNGVGTQLEVLSARAALTQAKTNYIQAIYDYQISLAKFDKAVGRDIPVEKE